MAALAAEMVVCFGYCEAAGDGRRFNAAICVSGDGTLGRHRKVHQPPGETTAYAPGREFAAFDTPVGRVGMLIDYDKTFPESARSLALDGAEILACLSAWPTSLTNRAPRMAQDRQSRLFDLYDRARAAENQVVLASSNQTGVMGGMRFLGQAKVVGPGGEILARTWSRPAWLSPKSTWRRKSPRRAGSCTISPNASRPATGTACTGPPCEDRAAELFHQAARRRRAYPRPGRGPGGPRPAGDRVDPGPRR